VVSARKVLFEPAAQQTPLAQQRLVCRLDRDFASFLVSLAQHDAVGRQQALLDQERHQRSGLLRNLGKPRHAPAGAASLGTDAGKPRDQAAPQQREPRLAVARDARIAIGSRHRAFHSGFNRAANAAERLVVDKP
jgi:hypothetical protein